MLRLLTIHGRLLAFGTNKRSSYFSQSNHPTSVSASRADGSPVKSKIRSLLRRMFSNYRIPIRKHSSFGVPRIKGNSYHNNYSRGFYSLSMTSFSATRHAQFAWKRLSLISSRSGPSFLPLSRAACALSLSFTRFHLVPGILALVFGKVACSQKALADGFYVPARDGLYMRAEDGQLIISSIVCSIIDSLSLLFRAVYLAILFFPATALAPFANSFGTKFRKKWLCLVHRTLEMAGPAFIKWGQWAATRPDLFPSDLCVELAKLHSRAPAHSFAYSKKAIEKAFGRKLHEIFEDFDEVPVASGSIAQVHRASLRHHKKEAVDVAVKVRHPGVGESIKKDFLIINLVARVSSLIPGLSWLRLDESVRQFAVFMMSQVDLSREAAHLSRFIYNFRRWKLVSFPKPLYPLVHPSVLVETFEQGESVSHFIDEIDGSDRIRRDLAHIGTYALLKMLLEDNFIHADMHPGNILVRVPQSNNRRKKLFRNRPHIIFLDVGMTAELSKTDRGNLREFFKAVAIRDGRTAAECTLRLSKQQNCPNPNAFIEELDKTFTFWGTPEGDIFHPVECMHQLLEQVRRHQVNVDGNVCTVLVTILVLEGWQRKLDPDFDIMQTLKSLLLDQKDARPFNCVFSS
uniref:ABC1 atypical kinase-like domain-containing protein n=1 Tax=Ananas comosus var. bracteatus TaxID=296719 RepID=A0A6V7NLT6_ANACO|nr:unnamed protein product [Ananas comosus var. bracteatus]